MDIVRGWGKIALHTARVVEYALSVSLICPANDDLAQCCTSASASVRQINGVRCLADTGKQIRIARGCR